MWLVGVMFMIINCSDWKHSEGEIGGSHRIDIAQCSSLLQERTIGRQEHGRCSSKDLPSCYSYTKVKYGYLHSGRFIWINCYIGTENPEQPPKYQKQSGAKLPTPKHQCYHSREVEVREHNYLCISSANHLPSSTRTNESPMCQKIGQMAK